MYYYSNTQPSSVPLHAQVHTDVENILKNFQDGTSDECCFDNHNVTTGSLLFESQGDTVAMAQPFFVSQLYSYKDVLC